MGRGAEEVGCSSEETLEMPRASVWVGGGESGLLAGSHPISPENSSRKTWDGESPAHIPCDLEPGGLFSVFMPQSPFST